MFTRSMVSDTDEERNAGVWEKSLMLGEQRVCCFQGIATGLNRSIEKALGGLGGGIDISCVTASSGRIPAVLVPLTPPAAVDRARWRCHIQTRVPPCYVITCSVVGSP